VQAALAELDRELDGEALRTQLVVSLDGASNVRQGEQATLWFHPAAMHVFDAHSGDNLTRDESKATQIAKESDDERLRQLERGKAAQAS
jgi:multiple sugar transport system ATP-binding protein